MQRMEVTMPNIKPISDLRSYTSVLDEVTQGSPVFLTKNGRGRYVILDISDYQQFGNWNGSRPISWQLSTGFLVGVIMGITRGDEG
jgi:prevent-host-death family protein